MWNFMSQYTLNDACDKTLKWRLNIDTEGFEPQYHSWKVTNDGKTFRYGIPGKANNADNNVYPSLQFEAGDYKLIFESEGTEGNQIQVMVETLDGKDVLFNKVGEVGKPVVMPFSVDKYGEFKITIVKTDAADKFTSIAIHSCEAPAEAVNSEDTDINPDDATQPEGGTLVEIPQDQGKQYDDFTRTKMEVCDGYTLYTATGDLQIAMKMMDIDVKDCDYVLIKFAEPVAGGWKAAFWSGTDTVDVPAESTEYKFELEPSMLQSGILPQICLMTLWGAPNPLEAKVAGVYKHNVNGARVDRINIDTASATYYNLSGQRLTAPAKGINIVRSSDGHTRKIVK